MGGKKTFPVMVVDDFWVAHIMSSFFSGEWSKIHPPGHFIEALSERAPHGRTRPSR